MKKSFLTTLTIAIAIGANAQLTEAIKLTDREQFERATAMFKQLLTTSPNDGATWYWFGENYYRSEQNDSAEYCYKHGLEVNPRFPFNQAGMGKIAMLRGDRTAATAAFNSAIATADDKTNKFGKEMRAATYREVAKGYGTGKNPDTAAAMNWLNRALELTPADPDCFVVKGDLILAGGGFDVSAAVEAFKHASELAPSNARPVALKALMYFRAKSFDASIAEFDKAISVDPGFAPAYSGRAEAYYRTKQYDKATADYQKYLELNAGSISARVRYAKFLYLIGKYDDSLAEIAKLQGSGVKDNALLRVKGFDQCELGQFAAALATMKDYFALQPQEKVLSDDYEIMGRIHTGLAKDQVNLTPDANGTIHINDPDAQITDQKENKDGSTTLHVKLTNHDSLAAEYYLKAARMDKSKSDLYGEAGKAFSRAKLNAQAVAVYREKIAVTGKAKSEDWYYIGSAAQKAKMLAIAHSAWMNYIEKQPVLFNGYLGRARANSSMDSTKTSWQAKPFYEDVIRKMTADEQTKKKVELEEAWFYLGSYWFTKEKDLGMAKCMFQKVKDVNAGTSNTKVGSDMLLTKELKDVTPKECMLQ